VAPTRSLQPRKVPRQARGWETRERVLEAAARVFAEYGYAAGTTNRIAEAAGMSVGSLYQYFPNKDAILVALVRRHTEEGAVRLTALWAEAVAAPTLADRVALFVDAVIANHRDQTRLHQVLFEEAPRPPELLADLHRLEVQLVDAVAGLLAVDPAVRPHQDLRVVAWFSVAAVESLTHRYVSSHPHGDLAVLRQQLIDLVVAYLSRAAP
jgi:AcrR family transcriptional regulator